MRNYVRVLEDSALADGVHPGAEGKDLLGAVCMPDQDSHPCRLGLGLEFLHEPGFPDPPLAEDHRESPAPAASRGHRAPQRLKLTFSPHECRLALCRTPAGLRHRRPTC